MEKNKKRKSQAQEVWRRFKKNKPAVVGLIVFSIIFLIAIFGNVIIPESHSIKQSIMERLQEPSAKYIFGTDAYGRDQFARVIHSARVSIFIGVGTSLFAMLVGFVIGAFSTLYGQVVDNILMRIVDVIASTPPLLLAIILIATFGSSMLNLMISIAISNVPTFSRLARSTMLGITTQDYVVAARAYGTSDARLIIKHIIPNAMGPMIVQTTMSVADMILMAAGLSYIGLGIQPPTPEWGSMLNAGREFMQTNVYLLVYPGVAILLSALSVSLLGDGLRDALDPRLKS